MYKELFIKIFKDKFATLAVAVLIFLYLLILFADFIAPYSAYSDVIMVSAGTPEVPFGVSEETEE